MNLFPTATIGTLAVTAFLNGWFAPDIAALIAREQCRD